MTLRSKVVAAGRLILVTAVVLTLAGCSGDDDGGGDDRSGSPTSTDTEASTSTTAPPFEPQEISLVAAGDVLLHSPLWDQAAADAAAQGREGYDFAPMLAGIEPLVSEADLAICHLETPVAPPGGPYSSYPSFSVPPEIATGLAQTGFDACSTASNHTYDQGADGVDRTLEALDAAGIAHAGSARNRREADRITMVDVDGAPVAMLSYTYGFNGIPAPDGQTWRANPIDEATIMADAAEARAEGAELVVVSLHWGDEYNHEPNAQQLDLAPRLIASVDIDLLLGHHAHVVQPVEQLEGGWVVYGMGNMVAHQETLGPEKAEGLLVRFTFTERRDQEAPWRVTGAEYAPLLLDRYRSPSRLVVVADELAAAGGPGDAGNESGASPDRLQDAWDRTVEVVNRRRAAEDGLTPID